MSVVKDDRTRAQMALSIDSFPGTPSIFGHAGIRPPEAATPNGRTAIGLFVTDQEVLSGTANSASLEAFVSHEVDPAHCDAMRLVGVLSQEKTVVPIADLVRVKFPLPPHPVVITLCSEGSASEQIALVIGVADNSGAPPVGQNWRGGRRTVVTMGRKGIVIIVRVQLHEQADLLQVVQAVGSLALGLGLGEGGEEHPGKNGDNRNDDKQFDQCKAFCTPRSLQSSHKKWVFAFCIAGRSNLVTLIFDRTGCAFPIACAPQFTVARA